MSYGTQITLDLPYAEAVSRVRAALTEQGFGVLTEIDVTATLQAKLGEKIEDYIILGACNPPFASQALGIDRSIGVLLPCNVVVRSADGGTVVEALDPQIMVTLTGRPELKPVADEVAGLAEQRAGQPHRMIQPVFRASFQGRPLMMEVRQNGPGPVPFRLPGWLLVARIRARIRAGMTSSGSRWPPSAARRPTRPAYSGGQVGQPARCCSSRARSRSGRSASR